jgi:hypothetical protein
MARNQPAARSTRRAFLRRSAAVTAAAVGATTLAPTAAAERSPAPHVTLSFDQQRLEQYRPLLDIPSGAEFASPEWYGWVAESPEYDTTCLVYFAFYQGQRGWTRADSHRGDREPVYCFVDQYGTVTEVVYSAWHWMQAASSSPHLYEPDGGGTHVTARTFEPHHQYKLTDENAGRLLSVNELGTSDGAPFTADLNSDVQFERWLAQGWSEALHPGAATEPWIMRNRDSWWRDGTERYARAVWNVQLQLAQFGFGGLAGAASNTDLADQ